MFYPLHYSAREYLAEVRIDYQPVSVRESGRQKRAEAPGNVAVIGYKFTVSFHEPRNHKRVLRLRLLPPLSAIQLDANLHLGVVVRMGTSKSVSKDLLNGAEVSEVRRKESDLLGNKSAVYELSSGALGIFNQPARIDPAVFESRRPAGGFVYCRNKAPDSLPGNSTAVQ